jgi:hypothetical protein
MSIASNKHQYLYNKVTCFFQEGSYSVGRYISSELDDCIMLMEVHIYRDIPTETLGRRSCAETVDITARDHKRHPEGSLMGWIKPHGGGNPGSQISIL